MRRFQLCLAMIAAVGVLGLVFSAPVSAQKKGKTRPLTTHDLMKGLVAAQCKALGANLKQESPDWKAARLQAALLNEAGYILMADGRCPSGDWAGATKVLKECSAVVLDKVEAEDAAGAKSAFGAMTKACAACHKAHKPKKE